jgi:hypothetical protein
MSKRAAASFLWFAATWLGYEILWSIGGPPRMLGPILAACVAMIVFIDPPHLFWPRPEVSDPAPVDRGGRALDAGVPNSN